MSGEDAVHDELDELAENISRMLEAEDAKIYSAEVIAEFRNPKNVGRMGDADGVGIADGLCVDTMEMYLKVREGVVKDCRFFTDGCGASIACGSRLTRFVTGRTLKEAAEVRPQQLVAMLGGLPPDHEHCAALAVIALRNALRDYQSRAGTKGSEEGT